MPYLARRDAAPSFHPVNGMARLDDDLYFFTDIPRAPGSFAPVAGNFFNEDGTGPVPLIDDASLVVRTPRGMVVIVGCGHAGYTNIIAAIHEAFPQDRLLAVIGGLHLLNAPENVLADAIDCTKRIMADGFFFCCGHCTGENVLRYFGETLGEHAVRSMGAGRSLVF